MKYRCSNSVIGFSNKIKNIWKIEEWAGVDDEKDEVLFFGMYHDFDYDAYRNFEGKRSVFWCGSDILRLMNNHDYQRIIKLYPATHYTENQVEADNLKKVGIEAIIIPSFLEDIDDFPVSFEPTDNPHIFMSAHQQREDEYGFDLAIRIAPRVPEAVFHLYGVDKSFYNENYFHELPENIIIEGNVSPERFNKDISKYHCGLRPNEHDGFSEITTKSVLLGQYPITKIKYDKIWNYRSDDELVMLIKDIRNQKKPNYETRSYYLKLINQYPWCVKKFWKK